MLNVIDATYRNNFIIFVKFDNGVEKEIDFSDYLKNEKRAVFSFMKDIDNFKKFEKVNNTICWNGIIDIAPEFLLQM